MVPMVLMVCALHSEHTSGAVHSTDANDEADDDANEDDEEADANEDDEDDEEAEEEGEDAIIIIHLLITLV